MKALSPAPKVRRTSGLRPRTPRASFARLWPSRPAPSTPARDSLLPPAHSPVHLPSDSPTRLDRRCNGCPKLKWNRSGPLCCPSAATDRALPPELAVHLTNAPSGAALRSPFDRRQYSGKATARVARAVPALTCRQQRAPPPYTCNLLSRDYLY